MFGLDDQIAALTDQGGLALVVLVAVLLGLRHATDPDHLTAVSTLVAGDRQTDGRAALRLGLAWGLGHATTLLAFGLPFVLWGDALPDAAQRAAELTVAALIVVLAVRLLMQWRAARSRGVVMAAGFVRSPRTAYGIGLVHGMGGSAGVGILVVGSIDRQGDAVAALMVLAAGTAVAMACASAAFGQVLAAGPSHRREALTPVMGAAALAFGAWYGLGATGSVPYVF